MKKINVILSVIALMLSFVATSCGDDDDESVEIGTAIVTVKYDESKKCYFQVDEQTVINPLNIEKLPYNGKEVRALTQFTPKGETIENGINVIDANIYWIDSILTKPTHPSLSKEMDIQEYGNDPIEVLKDWTTVAEDGYITLHFAARWGVPTTPHRVNLIKEGSSDNPFEFVFHHDANGDRLGNVHYGYVAFNIKDVIAKTGRTPKEVVVKYNSYDGEKTITLKYNPSTAQNADVENVGSVTTAIE